MKALGLPPLSRLTACFRFFRLNRDVPPSQGGRYVGFGNTPDLEPSQGNGIMSSFNYGWSTLASGAGKLASAAAKGSSRVASTATKRTKDFSHNVSEKVRGGENCDRREKNLCFSYYLYLLDL